MCKIISELVKSDSRVPFGVLRKWSYAFESAKDGVLAFVNRKKIYGKNKYFFETNYLCGSDSANSFQLKNIYFIMIKNLWKL